MPVRCSFHEVLHYEFGVGWVARRELLARPRVIGNETGDNVTRRNSQLSCHNRSRRVDAGFNKQKVVAQRFRYAGEGSHCVTRGRPRDRCGL